MGKIKLTRRQFMATVTAGTGSVLLGNAVGAIPLDRKTRVVDPFKTVTLGNRHYSNARSHPIATEIREIEDEPS